MNIQTHLPNSVNKTDFKSWICFTTLLFLDVWIQNALKTKNFSCLGNSSLLGFWWRRLIDLLVPVVVLIAIFSNCTHRQVIWNFLNRTDRLSYSNKL